MLAKGFIPPERIESAEILAIHSAPSVLRHTLPRAVQTKNVSSAAPNCEANRVYDIYTHIHTYIHACIHITYMYIHTAYVHSQSEINMADVCVHCIG